MQKQSFQHIPLIFRPHAFPADFPVLAFLGDYWKITAASPEYLHFHNGLEIGRCISGHGSILLDAHEPVSFQDGDFSILFPHTPHISVCASGESRWEYLYLDPRMLLEKNDSKDCNLWQIFYMPQSIPYIIRQESFPLIYDYLNKAFQEFHGQQALCQAVLHGYLTALLAELNRASPAPQFTGRFPDQGSHACLYDALTYIHEHYAEPICIRELSSCCCISESHLRRLFKVAVGVSPLEYIQHYRIRQACRLIQENREPVNLIARRVGYSSLSSFNRQFRQYIHCSPTAWMKAHLTAPPHHEVFSYEDEAFRF